MDGFRARSALRRARPRAAGSGGSRAAARYAASPPRRVKFRSRATAAKYRSWRSSRRYLPGMVPTDLVVDRVATEVRCSFTTEGSRHRASGEAEEETDARYDAANARQRGG